jgi:uncharacterized membrane protein (DUF4010 family)
MIDDLQPHLVALAIGLLIGFERERHHKGRVGSVGLRTTALAALAGSLAARLNPAALAVVLGILGAYALTAFVTSTKEDRGLTSEVALLVAGLLGAVALDHARVAVAVAVLVVVVLSEKERLHRLAGIITETELGDVLRFFVAAFVVLPLLPDRRFGPGGAVEPARVWRLVVLITAIGLVGYVAVRILGPGRGLMVAGAAGGFVSAAATTGAMGRTARTPALTKPALAGALLASVATLVQLVVVVGIAGGDLLGRVVPAAVVGSVVLGIEAWLLGRGDHADRVDDDGPPGDQRAFALKPAVLLAGLLTVVLVGVAWLREHVGAEAAVAGAALAGAADVHSAAAATASLAADGALETGTAVVAIGAALAMNTVTKIVVAFVGGGPTFGRRFAARLVLPIAVVAAALALPV